jgi:hypothetical protein
VLVEPSPSTALKLARAVRCWLRWSMLFGFVFGMASWVWRFDAGQFLVVMWAGVLWFCFGVLGVVACGAEVLFAAGRHEELKRVRPSWGSALWALVPVVFFGCAFLDVDARLWFSIHR